ncbi:unnamed protein product, partial [Tetraodon nigroviridis]
MDCSEEAPCVGEEASSQLELKKGMSIFIDILRRADKNDDRSRFEELPILFDDGKLSFDEFKAYFSDGVLTAEELKELFHTIDTHNTESVASFCALSDMGKQRDSNCFYPVFPSNVDTDELCDYFSQHLGEYEKVLAALEDLNLSILKAMDKTKKDYQESTHLEQFVTRFLLKETTNQLHSLQSSLECAMETTAEQTRQEKRAGLQRGPEVFSKAWVKKGCCVFARVFMRTWAPPQRRSLDGAASVAWQQGPVKPDVLSIQRSGRRSNRRLQRNNSLSPNNPLLSLVSSGVYDEDSQWVTQVNRLQKLLDRLEQKVLRSAWSRWKRRSRRARRVPGQRPDPEALTSDPPSLLPLSPQYILVVQRQLSVVEEELEEFRLALRQYTDGACAQPGCLHVSVQRLADESRFILYEFWEHNNVWKNHLQTNYSKTFQRANVDFLETPEIVTTMLVPGSWWVLNNN